MGYEMRIIVFFFKQKTAYEMRISDWSSDVCSSDLLEVILVRPEPGDGVIRRFVADDALGDDIRLIVRILHRFQPDDDTLGIIIQIGRASCRERVCQYV